MAISKENTILIVDDNPDNLDVLFQYLNRLAEFTVFVAKDGETAIKQAQLIQPNLILLDVMMPGLNGFETCRRLKSQAQTRDIPVIIMTALTDLNSKMEGFEAGAVDYITKPFQIEEVLARLNTHLSLRRLQKNLQDQNVRLKQEISQHKKTKQALRTAYDKLEQRVEERTTELSQTNIALKREISERKQAQLELHRSDERFRQIISSISDHVYVTKITEDNHRTNLYISPNVQDLTGYPQESFLEDWYFWNSTVIHPEDRDIAATQIELLSNDHHSETEYRLIRANDEVIWVRDSARIEVEGKSKIIYGVVSNITERKRTEESLKRLEQRYRSLFEEAPAMYVIAYVRQDELIVEDHNLLFSNVLCYEPEEIVERPLANFYTLSSYAELFDEKNYRRTPHKTSVTRECQLLTGDGRIFETLSRITPEIGPDGQISGVRIMYVDITERKKAETKLWQHAQRMHILHQIDHGILTAQSAEAIARAVLHRILQLVPCQQASVTLFDFDAQEILVFAISMNPNIRLGVKKRIPLQAFGSLVDLQQGKTRIVKNLSALDNPSSVEQMLLDEGLQSVICFPFIARGELIGSLNLGSTKLDAFDPDHMEIAGEVARQLTVAILQSRLFEAEAQRRQEAEALRDTAIALNSSLNLTEVLKQILANVGHVIPHDAANIILIENNAGQVIGGQDTAKPGLDEVARSLFARITQTSHLELMVEDGQPLIIEDTQDDHEWNVQWHWVRAYMGIPICVNKKAIGLLNLASSNPNFFRSNHTKHLRAFTNQVALAIERARLHSQTQVQAKNLDRLNRAGQALTSTLDLNTILELVMEEANALVNAEGSAVLLVDPASNELVFAAVVSPGAHKMMGKRVPLDASIAGWAFTQQTSVLVEDAQNDQRFYKFIDTVTGLTTQSIIAVPLICKQDVVGVLETTNKLDQVFNQSDLEVLESLANSAAIAIQNARLFEQLQAGRKRLRRLSNQIVAAQEKERQRLSYELHDEAGQILTALKIRLDLILTNFPDNAKAHRKHLSEAVSMVDMTMDRLRALARALRPPALDTAGLNPTLEGLCREFARWADLSISYQGTDVNTLSESVDITLYRYLQEALTNVAKHAQASQVSVTLNIDSRLAHLTIQDNGKGFDKQMLQELTNRPKSIGLLGMQERVELLDGWSEIDTAPGQGTRVSAYIPVEVI